MFCLASRQWRKKANCSTSYKSIDKCNESEFWVQKTTYFNFTGTLHTYMLNVLWWVLCNLQREYKKCQFVHDVPKILPLFCGCCWGAVTSIVPFIVVSPPILICETRIGRESDLVKKIKAKYHDLWRKDKGTLQTGNKNKAAFIAE